MEVFQLYSTHDRGWVMISTIERFVRDEQGATAIEYALIASLMAIMGIAALSALGDNMSAMYNEVDVAMDGAVNGS